jgi:hypothetical protein
MADGKIFYGIIIASTASRSSVDGARNTWTKILKREAQTRLQPGSLSDIPQSG